jgi:acyl-CoA thioesterase YciA
MPNRTPQPRGKLALRTVAMQSDTNAAGHIFGGWIMYLMDLAVGVAAGARAKGHVATAAVSNLTFLQVVKVGDVVCVYTNITRIGQTSMTVAVDVYADRDNHDELARVTSAEFVAVAVDDHRMPRTMPRADQASDQPSIGLADLLTVSGAGRVDPRQTWRHR